MSDDNKAGSPDTNSKNSSEASPSGHDSLQSILDDFDRKGASSTDDSKPEVKVELTADEKAELTNLRNERIDRQLKTALEDVVTILTGDTEADEATVRGWLEMQVEDNPDISKLVDMRFSNKQQFKKAVKLLAPDFKDYVETNVKQPEPNKSGLGAAVRRSRETLTSSKDFGDVNFADMSDSDFAMKSREVLRAAEAGELN